MSTRCFIGLKENDIVEFIYCHHDGYIKNGVGEKLVTEFNSVEKIKKLLSQGNRSSLDETEAYGGSEEKSLFYPESTYLKCGFNSDTEYIYLFKDGEWLYSDVCSWHGKRASALIPVKSKL